MSSTSCHFGRGWGWDYNILYQIIVYIYDQYFLQQNIKEDLNPPPPPPIPCNSTNQEMQIKETKKELSPSLDKHPIAARAVLNEVFHV